MILSMFLVFGCVSQETATPQDSSDTTIYGESQKVEAINKTGYEQTQDTITLAIADGTYTQEVSYEYHSGTESMEVSLSVENDIITSASIVPKGTPHQYSLKLMNDVNSALPNLVVGKKIDELDLPKNISGASLTTGAFKQYVNRLIEEY